MYQNESLYIFTGGPGSGKTSVINELKRLGRCCADEVARKIIQREVNSGGEGLPWKNTALYTSYMVRESVTLYRQHLLAESPVFFDRGIPDCLAYAQLIGLKDLQPLWERSQKYWYNKRVFLFPPWQKIYCGDEERKQTFQEAVETFDRIESLYKELGYLFIEVPPVSVSDRVAFILSFLHARP